MVLEMPDYPIHPACALWPRPSDEEILAIAADIKTNGLLNPIWLYEGAILDGKTRLEACGIASVEPRFETYAGKDPIGFVIAQNAKRRHLPKHELTFLAEELAQLKRGRPQINVIGNTIASQSKTMVEIGDQLGVSRQNIEAARYLKKNGESNIIEMAKTGKVGVQNAARFAADTPREEQRTATLEKVRKHREFRKATLTLGIRRNKDGVPVHGKRNVPVTIPSKKTLEERKKPQLMLTIPARDVTEKFRSLIKQVKEQSKKHPATVSFGVLAVIAFELEQLADSWTENGSENGTHSEPAPRNSVHNGG